MCCSLIGFVFKFLSYIFAGIVVISAGSYLVGFTTHINCGHETLGSSVFCRIELITNQQFTSYEKCIYFNNYQFCLFTNGIKVGSYFQKIKTSFGY
jgi:hypothetical protein